MARAGKARTPRTPIPSKRTLLTLGKKKRKKRRKREREKEKEVDTSHLGHLEYISPPGRKKKKKRRRGIKDYA